MVVSPKIVSNILYFKQNINLNLRFLADNIFKVFSLSKENLENLFFTRKEFPSPFHNIFAPFFFLVSRMFLQKLFPLILQNQTINTLMDLPDFWQGNIIIFKITSKEIPFRWPIILTVVHWKKDMITFHVYLRKVFDFLTYLSSFWETVIFFQWTFLENIRDLP